MKTAKQKPNILILWGDDIGWWNISYNSRGQMGYRTPNIDRVANEGVAFTDYYAQQSCTAGRAAFMTGQNPLRTGLTKVGMPGGTNGIQAEDPTIAELLKPLGYATGQFGKNHFGDRDEHLPTAHGFDEFFGNLYHLNAEEEPEHPDYPKDPAFKKQFGPRGVIHSFADGRVKDTGAPALITRDRLNVREGPGGNFGSLGSVAIGTIMAVIGISPDREWYVVNIPTNIARSGQGWVAARFVNAQNVSNVPVVQPPPVR